MLQEVSTLPVLDKQKQHGMASTPRLPCSAGNGSGKRGGPKRTRTDSLASLRVEHATLAAHTRLPGVTAKHRGYNTSLTGASFTARRIRRIELLKFV